MTRTLRRKRKPASSLFSIDDPASVRLLLVILILIFWLTLFGLLSSCHESPGGVGRGLGGNPRALLDELEKLQAAGVENTARRFIEQAVEERPQDFDDNLTLAVIRAE
jgi:hypothetical protein